MKLKKLTKLIRDGVEQYERSMSDDGFEPDDDVEPRECITSLGDLLEENLERHEAEVQGITI